MKEQYRTSEEQYEMEFVDTTVIQPLFQALTSYDMPQYCEIGTIPHDHTCQIDIAIIGLHSSYSNNVYSMLHTSDILENFLHVEPLCTIHLARLGTEAPARDVPVREMVMVDASLINLRPIIVSIWNDLAIDKCEKVVGLFDPMLIVGLTGLKSSSHKGVLYLRRDFIYICIGGLSGLFNLYLSLYDETSSIALTAFFNDAIKLLGKDADALYNIAYETQNKFLKQATESYKEKLVYAELSYSRCSIRNQ
ncbi:hypothetical protein Cgig2_029787 [Carnegiea gigantea]|uniref:Uncharacterized protein n=1 Tax=Carnegiea gigantea TaxID=171969 RepID=A0A9Q1QKF2_9CARY|nr:hypothetical protein Cgig2_029787 [Carnegiea gigantea]